MQWTSKKRAMAQTYLWGSVHKIGEIWTKLLKNSFHFAVLAIQGSQRLEVCGHLLLTGVAETCLQSCSCSCTHLWAGMLQQEGILNRLWAVKLWLLLWGNWESMGETNNSNNKKIQSKEEKQRKGDATHCSTYPTMMAGKPRNCHPWGLFRACRISSSPSPTTPLFMPVL